MTPAPPPLELEDQPGGPPAGSRLAHLDDFGASDTLARDFVDGRRSFEMVLVRRPDGIIGFQNRCPHANTRLDVFESGFFDSRGAQLECGTHGALFDPDSGLCTSGPCRGKWLRQVAIAVDDDGWIVSV